MKVLIIEDKPERIAELLKIYINQDVSIADNVDAARNALTNFNYDLIQFDYDLYDRTSSEITDLIDADTLIVIHSENLDGVIELQGQIPGALAVPFHLLVKKSELVSKLKAMLSSDLDVNAIQELLKTES